MEDIKNHTAPEDTASAEEPMEELAEEVVHEPTEEDTLRSELEAARAELKEKDDRHLRLAAEYDNFRRRSREEKDGIYDNAVSDTLTELLPVIDNLERATLFDDGEKVKEGLQMTLKTVASVLGKLHVEEYGAPGDTFDPKLHNAVMHVEDDTFGAGEIVEVFQKGYRKGSKIIRFAMVKTAN